MRPPLDRCCRRTSLRREDGIWGWGAQLVRGSKEGQPCNKITSSSGSRGSLGVRAGSCGWPSSQLAEDGGHRAGMERYLGEGRRRRGKRG